MPVDKIGVTHRETNAQTSVNPEFLDRGLLLSLEVLQVDSMVGAHHFTSGDVMDPNPVDGAINRKRWICHAPLADQTHRARCAPNKVQYMCSKMQQNPIYRPVVLGYVTK
jgi:hypothetical protein